MRNSKPSSADVFGLFLVEFFDFFSCTLPMGYAVNILGFGPPKGVLLQKKKIFHFSRHFHEIAKSGHSRLGHYGFFENLENLE